MTEKIEKSIAEKEKTKTSMSISSKVICRDEECIGKLTEEEFKNKKSDADKSSDK
jgi:hypothetical protein